MERIKKDLPFYILIGILIFSSVLHVLFLVKNPGENYVQVPTEHLQQRVDDGDLTEYDAKLKEHTWKYGSRDGYLYSKMANQIIEKGVYGYDTHNNDEVESNAFVTPGYPMILVSLFSIANVLNIDQMLMVKLFNMALSITTIFLIYLITVKVFKNKWMGIVASGIYATYFPVLHYFRSALTEIPGIFFYCLALYLFILAYQTNKKWVHFLFALTFCYAIMIRPVIAPLILLGYILIIIKHRHHYKEWIGIGLIWSLGAMIVILPWVVRNYIMFNEFILFSTHSGNSWYAGSNPFNLYNGSDYFRERESLGLDGKEYAFLKIKEGLKDNFSLWVSWFTLGKTYELFKIPDAVYFYGSSKVFYLIKIYHRIVVIIGFATAFISRKKEAVAFILLFVIYVALSNLFLTIPRYGFYIMPIISILNGYAIITVLSKLAGYLNTFKANKLSKPV